MDLVIYSALLGARDKLRSSKWPMICFSDTQQNVDGITIRSARLTERTPRLNARWHKINHHLVLPEAEISLWMDATHRLLVSPDEILNLLGDADIAAFQHPSRNCVYDEAVACRTLGLDSAVAIGRAEAQFHALKHPRKAGLHATGVLVRRHNEKTKVFAEAWWNAIKTGSWRDQLSFDPLVRKFGIKIATIKGNIYKTPLFDCAGHITRELDPTKPGPFKEHKLAHKWLDGLKGLEVGSALHNPFGLKTRNVAPKEIHQHFDLNAMNLFRTFPTPIDIDAWAHKIPVEDSSEDFIISSHVVEHLPDVIGTFLEWNRIVKKDGYIFMILPRREAVVEDRNRPLASVEHFIADWWAGKCVGVIGDKETKGPHGHLHVFTPDSLINLVDWMSCGGCVDFNWRLVDRENIDTKVGNGFTLVYRVKKG